MSTATARDAGSNTNAILASMVAMFCTVIVAIVLVVIFAPSGTDVGGIITGLIGTMTTAVPVLLTLAKIRGLEQRVEGADAKLDYLANGGTDAKNRAALADVLPEQLLRPEYITEQLEADRAHREAGPTTHTRKDDTA